MKTITEFAGVTIKNAAQTKQKILSDIKATAKAAKAPAKEAPAEAAPVEAAPAVDEKEAISKAVGEALKVEGDKLNLLLSALEAVGNKTNDLKRIVVMTLNEGEKPPLKTQKVGEHYFAIEYYPPLHKKGEQGRGHGHHGDKEGRGGKRGKGGKGDRDRRGRRGRRGERPEGAEGGPQGAPRGGERGAGAPGGEGQGDQRRRRPPRNRGERKPGGPGQGGPRPGGQGGGAPAPKKPQS